MAAGGHAGGLAAIEGSDRPFLLQLAEPPDLDLYDAVSAYDLE